MKCIAYIIFLYGALVSIPQHYSMKKSIEKNGMQVTWQFRGDFIEFEVFAPTKGWVAIGFNESEKLIGTNLIMGNIVNATTTVSDRYIVGFGDHQAVEQLKGLNHLSQISGAATSKGTIIKFSICRKAKDKYHFDLLQNRSFNLLLAYSQSVDFDHHSTM